MRWCLLSCGLLFTGLGMVGAFLPLLPTTPFLLLAAACFARSSPAFHQRLLANRAFGPYIHQWQQDRTIPLAAKYRACGLIVLTFSISIVILDPLWLRLMLACIGTGLILFLASRPTTSSDEEPGEQD